MTAEPGADAQDSEDAAKGSAKAETETSSAAATESESAEPDECAAEGVEIPKQQSAEEAADSEAGEGARK
ncbi:gliding motility protein [Streptomyces phaeochromogenes]|uniref:gliding motility protein n=1 Tax=Streptomyces phaeochromogenes TaxID=1923 RepID=UPI0033F394C2